LAGRVVFDQATERAGIHKSPDAATGTHADAPLERVVGPGIGLECDVGDRHLERVELELALDDVGRYPLDGRRDQLSLWHGFLLGHQNPDGERPGRLASDLLEADIHASDSGPAEQFSLRGLLDS